MGSRTFEGMEKLEILLTGTNHSLSFIEFILPNRNSVISMAKNRWTDGGLILNSSHIKKGDEKALTNLEADGQSRQRQSLLIRRLQIILLHNH